jgi:hypothetical protein
MIRLSGLQGRETNRLLKKIDIDFFLFFFKMKIFNVNVKLLNKFIVNQPMIYHEKLKKKFGNFFSFLDLLISISTNIFFY